MRRALLVIAATALVGASLAPVVSADRRAEAGNTGRPKVLVVGDSMAIGLVNHMKGSASPDYDEDYRLINRSDGACNIGKGTLLAYTGITIPSGACENWANDWAGHIARYDPDIAILITGGWDITDRWGKNGPKSGSAGNWNPPPKFRISQRKGNQRYYKKLTQAIDVLKKSKTHVIVVSEPYANPLQPTPSAGTGLDPIFWHLHWEPYSDTPPGPSPEWEPGWQEPSTGATYISSRKKIDKLIRQQEKVKAREFANKNRIEVFSFRALLSPGGNSYADAVCTPVTVPPTTECADVDKVLIRTGDGYHLTEQGNTIVADALDARLREILGLAL